ncbi:MAG TPA: hypothetical protein VFU41_01155 [Gemmatimonadales bacterium]|nr:hypothetical protein [Gemmatimonadales bacterium]
MDLLVVARRLVHVVLGALWVGMAVFTATFLTPAIQDTGPDGGKVMVALQRRGVMTVLPVLAVGTLLSGIWLYWRASFGFHPSYLTPRVGLAFALGGAAPLVAYGLGITVVRPAMLRATALAQALGSATTEQERAKRLAEIQRLRARGATAGRLVARLLIVAAAAMAIARYV